jgi:tetratricopeptide (TPR) repeat protein
MHKLALSVIVLATASTAYAKPKPKGQAAVKAHMDRAAKAHKAGKFEVALTELKAAYDVEPQPKLLYAIAQVYAKLDNCTDAIDYYERFLAADTSKQGVVKQAIDACKKKLADKPDKPDDKGDGVFRTKKIDGELPTAEPIEPPPPPPPVEAKLEPAPPVVIEQPRGAERPPPAPVSEPVPSEPAPVATTQHSPWYRDALGDALVITGVAATVGSFFAYRAAQSDLDKAEDAGTLDAYNDLRDSAETKQLYTVVLAGGGLALVTAGVLRYALRDNRRETRGVAIVPTTSGGLITWSGGF